MVTLTRCCVTSTPKSLPRSQRPNWIFPFPVPLELRDTTFMGGPKHPKSLKTYSLVLVGLSFFICKWEQYYLICSVAWLIILECFRMHGFIWPSEKPCVGLRNILNLIGKNWSSDRLNVLPKVIQLGLMSGRAGHSIWVFCLLSFRALFCFLNLGQNGKLLSAMWILKKKWEAYCYVGYYS